MKKYKFIRSLFLLVSHIILLTSCGGEAPSDDQTNDSSFILSLAEKEKARLLLQNNCYNCHSPSASEQARLAPPMEGVKRRYLAHYGSNTSAREAIIAFSMEPSAQKVVMKKPYKRFGLMPNMGYKKEELELIASYILSEQLEYPDWFDEHYEKNHGSNQASNENEEANANLSESYEQKLLAYGMQLASTTKGQLGKNLMAAINEDGPSYAVRFCNTHALPLTDSTAKALNASIVRRSDQARNPSNQANEDELQVISTFKTLLADGKNATTAPVFSGNTATMYFPILTGEMCLKCHGTERTSIQPETYATIKKLYPKDRAIGYKVGDLRGIWVVNVDTTGLLKRLL